MKDSVIDLLVACQWKTEWEKNETRVQGGLNAIHIFLSDGRVRRQWSTLA
jgi:hypothetical protein